MRRDRDRALRAIAMATHEALCERSETTAELARVDEHRAVYAMARERARLADGHERRVAGNLKQPLGRPRHAVRHHVTVHDRAGLRTTRRTRGRAGGARGGSILSERARKPALRRWGEVFARDAHRNQEVRVVVAVATAEEAIEHATRSVIPVEAAEEHASEAAQA